MINDQLNPNRMEQQISTERTGAANQGADESAQGCVATFKAGRPSRTFGTDPMAGKGEGPSDKLPEKNHVKLGVVADMTWQGFP